MLFVLDLPGFGTVIPDRELILYAVGQSDYRLVNGQIGVGYGHMSGLVVKGSGCQVVMVVAV